jgi:hypothetical protein
MFLSTVYIGVKKSWNPPKHVTKYLFTYFFEELCLKKIIFTNTLQINFWTYVFKPVTWWKSLGLIYAWHKNAVKAPVTVHFPVIRTHTHSPIFILTLILLMWRIGWAPNTIPIYVYIQQDATLHSLFISGTYSTCFGWYFHPSSGAHTTVSTEYGICYTVTAICRYRGRVGTGLSVLWLAYPTHSTLKPVPTLPR